MALDLTINYVRAQHDLEPEDYRYPGMDTLSIDCRLMFVLRLTNWVSHMASLCQICSEPNPSLIQHDGGL